MKNPKLRMRAGLFLLLSPLLAGCTDQDKEIASLKEKITAATDAESADNAKLSQMKKRLTGLTGELRAKANVRKDFEEKAKKSSRVEESFTKYRVELEISAGKFKKEIEKFRQQATAP
jgi:hypothetical protein